MWTCPSCGAKFVGKNASHSCVKQSLAEFFAGKPRAGVKHARALIAAVKKLGPVTLHPVKTRVALMVDVRFAAINRISDDSIRGHVWLREQHASDRFVKIEKLGAHDWLYHFVVDDEHPIDRELVRFLKLGYANGKR
jgi:hypothetical protein